MLEGVNAPLFLTRRRLIELRNGLKDIDQAILDASSAEARAWFSDMRLHFVAEIAELEEEERRLMAAASGAEPAR